MQIQTIEFPSAGEAERESLYVRKIKGTCLFQKEHILTLDYPGHVSFHTYFNAVSIEKWLKYTKLKDLRFEFTGKGNFRISVWNQYALEDGSFCNNVIAETHCESKKEEIGKIHIPLKDAQRGIIYIEVETCGAEGCEFKEGRFLTDTRDGREVSLILDICTYKREKYLLHNLETIRQKLWENPKSALYHRIHVIVADNGNTVHIEPAEEWLTVYPNKNAGGTAGFTRGMIEAQNKGDFTHILLMDDDIELKPSAIEKTYVLLSLLKEKYQDCMVGGAMLRRDYGFVQQESGGRYQNGRIMSLHSGVDLRKPENLILNESMENCDYNAWWYCCIPMKTILKEGLPLPLFIHNDDVEYGLRCNAEIIRMNGICVWHDAFENKRPSINEYYDVRNTLIVNAIYNRNDKPHQALKMVYRRMLTNLFRYRYRDIRLIEQALEDFLSGPQWLKEKDAQELHMELMASGYQYKETYTSGAIEKGKVTLEDILSGSSNTSRISKAKLLSLNGWLFPAKRGASPVPVMAGESPHSYYRVKQVWIYDPDTLLGFYTQKELKELFYLAGRMIVSSIRLCRKYKRTQRAYQQQAKTLCSEPFWNQYLNLKGERK